MTITTEILLGALTASSILHIAEEFIYPGGFYAEYKKMMAHIGLTTSRAVVVIINILFLGVVLMAFVKGNENPVFGLSVILLVFINGLLHIILSVYKRRYLPGLVTSLVLYIPLGVSSCFLFPLSIPEKLIALLIAISLHGTPFFILPLKTHFKK